MVQGHQLLFSRLGETMKSMQAGRWLLLAITIIIQNIIIVLYNIK